MEFKPSQDGEEAGLCVRANEDNHYEIGLARFAGKIQLFVRNRIKNREYFLALRPVESDKVQLEISGNEDQYQFAWSTDGKTWHNLAASASADLSREKAGGFTGTVIGLYATANGLDSQSYADFSWFEMGPDAAMRPMALTHRPPAIPLVSSDHWRIRSGWEEFKDKEGFVWSSDIGYSGGDVSRCWDSIAGTANSELYQFERSGPDFSYAFPVLPGVYQIRLLFAETQVRKEGERVFDVLINGKKVLDHLDVLQEAGGFDKAVDRTFRDIQPDAQGQIRIQFISSTQNAKICAIEVIRQR